MISQQSSLIKLIKIATILLLNFPILKKKGSAIFLHLIENGYKQTKGCIALKKKDLMKIIPLINNKTKIEIR